MRSARLLLALMLVVLPACKKPSRPGDDALRKASSAEEAAALRDRREELEQQFERELQQKDAEIARLEQENEELRRKLSD